MKYFSLFIILIVLAAGFMPAYANKADGKGRNVAHYDQPKKPPATKKPATSH
jgi:hypothetical protein